MFGLSGGHLLNVMYDLDHESRVDECIRTLIGYKRAGEDPNALLGLALRKACLDYTELTDDDAERIMLEVDLA